jgi:RHH-type rel operon transcriptional repressor/antitoxin RelB
MNDRLRVQLDNTTQQALDRLAEKTRRSREWHVTEAIKEYVAVQSWQLEKIETGIAAADQGDFASDDEIIRVRAKFSP